VSPCGAGNWVLWGGASPTPTASALNWAGPGEILANAPVIPAGGRSGSGPGGAILDFAVKYNGPSGSAQFVADVVGYLVEDQAVSLDCFENAIQSTTLAAISTGFITSAACDAGWT